jgi:twitching motility protein PilT
MNPEQLNKLLEFGLRSGASDVHLKAGCPPAFRINGRLQYLQAELLSPMATRQICASLIVDPRVREGLDRLHELDTSYSIPGLGRFRVSIYRQRGTLSAILRAIPNDVPNIEQLGLPPQVVRLANEERGLVLVTGPAGCGKSTTLAAFVHHINHTRNAHVVTVEDPIEYLHRNAQASISQREVGIDTDSFQAGLRAALRQDPDVVVVGELRDAEAVEVALRAVETGHAVFSAMHTPDVARTVSRLLSLFPATDELAVRLRLADCLKGVLSQRLLPRADGAGRLLACELMFATPPVQQCLRDPTRTGMLRDVMERNRAQSGMQTLDQHLAELCRAQLVTLETALFAAHDPAQVEQAVAER